MGKADKLLEQAGAHLHDGETVVAAVMGAYETKVMGSDSVRNGVLIATDRRLVFFSKKLGGYDIESFPYENISSFEQGKDMMMGHKVAFHASGNNVKIRWIKDVNALAAFIEATRGRMGKSSPPSMPVAAAPQTASDPVARLKKLAELRDAGLVSDEEFESQKARILADI